MAIQSFKDKLTEELFHGGKTKGSKRFKNIEKIIVRKLDMLNYAKTLSDLQSPPGNRLEALRGDLKGWYSIRVNDQFRIVFAWSKNGPEKVWVTDYHS